MLKDLELGKDLWGEAILTHVYLRNRCPSSILPGGITPYERVFGHVPLITHLRVFGTRCFIKVLDEHRTKLDDKARKCCLIGFEGESIYMVVDADKRKLRSHNIIFMEGNGKRSNQSEPSFPGLSDGTTAHIEDVTDNIRSEVEAENVVSSDTSNAGKRRTRSEVWGTDPMRCSGCLSTQATSDKVLITKSMKPESKPPEPMPMPSVSQKENSGKMQWTMNLPNSRK